MNLTTIAQPTKIQPANVNINVTKSASTRPEISAQSLAALEDALRQSMAANAALEAAVKIQGEELKKKDSALEALKRENDELKIQLRASEVFNVIVQQEAQQRSGPPPLYEDDASENDLEQYSCVADDSISVADLKQDGVQTEGCKEPNRVTVGVQTDFKDSKSRKRRSSSELKPMTLQNTSPLIAEAFRLGWLAGANPKHIPDSEPSTRSDDASSEPVAESVTESVSSGGGSSPDLKESLPSRASTPTPASPRSY